MTIKRRIFIINPKFQYKFCFVICSLVFLSSLIYPFTIYDLFEYLVSLRTEMTDEFAPQLSNLLTYLILTQAGFIGLVFIFCIFVSHKIAGPMFKLTRHLREIRKNKEIKHIYFRDSDQFHEVADEVNQTLDFLAKKSDQERELISEISISLESLSHAISEDKKPVLDEIQQKLKDLQKFQKE